MSTLPNIPDAGKWLYDKINSRLTDPSAIAYRQNFLELPKDIPDCILRSAIAHITFREIVTLLQEYTEELHQTMNSMCEYCMATQTKHLDTLKDVTLKMDKMRQVQLEEIERQLHAMHTQSELVNKKYTELERRLDMLLHREKYGDVRDA